MVTRPEKGMMSRRSSLDSDTAVMTMRAGGILVMDYSSPVLIVFALSRVVALLIPRIGVLALLIPRIGILGFHCIRRRFKARLNMYITTCKMTV
jgi:hypothetical protein